MTSGICDHEKYDDTIIFIDDMDYVDDLDTYFENFENRKKGYEFVKQIFEKDLKYNISYYKDCLEPADKVKAEAILKYLECDNKIATLENGNYKDCLEPADKVKAEGILKKLVCDSKIATLENGREVYVVKRSKAFLRGMTMDFMKNKSVQTLKYWRRYGKQVLDAAKDCLEPADIQKAEGIMKEIDNRLENLEDDLLVDQPTTERIE